MNNQTIHVTIEGMTCQACEKLVAKKLTKVEGITVVAVSQGKATISSDTDVNLALLQKAFEETEYKVTSIQGGIHE